MCPKCKKEYSLNGYGRTMCACASNEITAVPQEPFLFTPRPTTVDRKLAEATAIPNTEGIKHDAGKPKLSLLTPESLAYEAAAFEYGMKKYAKNNYKKGMDWSRVADAALRHMNAWSNKQDTDEESGLNHLAHAKACIAMLIYYVENKVGKDDR